MNAVQPPEREDDSIYVSGGWYANVDQPADCYRKYNWNAKTSVARDFDSHPEWQAFYRTHAEVKVHGVLEVVDQVSRPLRLAPGMISCGSGWRLV